MRSLLHDELPQAARTALRAHLQAEGQDPDTWRLRHVWHSGRAYAVSLLRREECRGFTIAPGGEGFDVFDVAQP